jgi:(p)ppGpp synthase/HD superfamily hydrolase
VKRLLLTERFSDALTYAAEAHRLQWRKGTRIPYLGHLLEVAGIVMSSGGSENEAIAALLHDAVEDQGGPARLADIRERFGDEVAGIVAECSDTDEFPKPPWRARKEAYVAHLETATPGALRVSLADKIHNARSILYDHRSTGPDVWNRFSATPAESVWYYRALTQAFDARVTADPELADLAPLVSELDRTVSALEDLVD